MATASLARSSSDGSQAMADVNEADFIEGVVYMPGPVRYETHGKPHTMLATWMGYYVGKTSRSLGYGDNGTVRLDNDNEPQPDLFLLLPSGLGGKAKIDEDDYVSGPPALVCEVAASSVSIDLHLKKTAYRRNGVQEYLVWRTEEAAVDWFTLANGVYVPLSPAADGTLRSGIFPGLWLNPAHLLNGDLPGESCPPGSRDVFARACRFRQPAVDDLMRPRIAQNVMRLPFAGTPRPRLFVWMAHPSGVPFQSVSRTSIAPCSTSRRSIGTSSLTAA